MAAVVGLTLVKQLTYRGDPLEEFANTYYFTGSVPANSIAWKATTDLLIAEEKTVYPATAKVIRAYGYNDDSDTATAVWSWDYLAQGAAVSGTLNPSSQPVLAGDCAVWCRWKLDHLNTKGRPVYLRKYFHPAVAAGLGGGAQDQILPAQKTALETFAARLANGNGVEGRVVRARTGFHDILSSSASPYVTTRTLKRRGKRPGA